MFGKLKSLLKRERRPVDFVQQIEAMAQETMGQIDFDNPAERVGVKLYFVLTEQFDLIGKRDGAFPFTPPFATAKARGALLGTAIAIVRQQFNDVPHDVVTDAAKTAFVLVFGKENGKFYALQTLRESADGNEDVNFASDWAMKDFDGATAENSHSTPSAYYLAVAEMI